MLSACRWISEIYFLTSMKTWKTFLAQKILGDCWQAEDALQEASRHLMATLPLPWKSSQTSITNTHYLQLPLSSDALLSVWAQWASVEMLRCLQSVKPLKSISARTWSNRAPISCLLSTANLGPDYGECNIHTVSCLSLSHLKIMLRSWCIFGAFLSDAILTV
jgi:predicted solute-binding protein